MPTPVNRRAIRKASALGIGFSGRIGIVYGDGSSFYGFSRRAISRGRALLYN